MLQTGPVTDERTKFGFALTVLFLVIEYARPQDIIPALGVIRPALILNTLLILSWFSLGTLSPAKSKQTIYMILILFLLASYIPFARNNFIAFAHTRGFLFLFPFFLSIILYVNTFERLKTLINVWIGLMLYIATMGIIGFGKAGSSFLRDENDFSLLMNMMLPFSIFLYMYEKKTSRKILLLLASLLALAGIVKSFSRGGFVGLLVVLAIVWLFSPRKILTLALVGILSAGLYFVVEQKYWSEMSTITDTGESTASQRLDSWKAGWAMFKDNPLGVGGGNFPVMFPQYQPPTLKRGMWGRAAHSIWFTLIPELGIIGVFLYGLLLRQNLRDIFWLKRLKNCATDNGRYAYYLSLAFLASMTGFFASGTFISVLYYPHYFYLTAMIVATCRIAKNETELDPPQQPDKIISPHCIAKNTHRGIST